MSPWGERMSVESGAAESGQANLVVVGGRTIPHQKGTTPWSQGVDPVLVPVTALGVGESPRLAGESAEHVKLLAEAEARLPPVLVHRQTMRVIDGVHRLRAAVLRGDREIAVEFFDGDVEEAFVQAVKANLVHGLPLSLADRRAAAARILGLYPEWSDRAVARTVGLSADTVALVRRESSEESVRSDVRIGRDGRARPVDPSQGRLRASEVLAARPDASLREVAREAGIAVGTVRDVRERLRRGEDPVPAKRQAAGYRQVAQEALPEADDRVNLADLLAILRNLKDDPSLKFSDTGRRLLRWLDVHAPSPADKAWALPAVPSHCANRIAELARGYAHIWHGFAEALERRAELDEM